jgi:hypothetical protein
MPHDAGATFELPFSSLFVAQTFILVIRSREIAPPPGCLFSLNGESAAEDESKKRLTSQPSKKALALSLASARVNNVGKGLRNKLAVNGAEFSSCFDRAAPEQQVRVRPICNLILL